MFPMPLSRGQTALIGGPSDLGGFPQATGEAKIVYLAGYRWDEDHPDTCGLIFRERVLTSAGFPAMLDGVLVVFSKVCETGLLPPHNTQKECLGLGSRLRSWRSGRQLPRQPVATAGHGRIGASDGLSVAVAPIRVTLA